MVFRLDDVMGKIELETSFLQQIGNSAVYVQIVYTIFQHSRHFSLFTILLGHYAYATFYDKITKQNGHPMRILQRHHCMLA